LKEEIRMRANENTMLRNILGPKMEEARGRGEKRIKNSFKMFDPH